VLALVTAVSACASQPTPSADLERETSPGTAAIDRDAVRNDVVCSAYELGEDDVTEIVSGHYVVDGNLGAVCFGEEVDTVVAAFEELAAITPPLQMRDLSLFGGFRWQGNEDEETLAYVTTMEDDDTQFVLMVGIDSFDADRATARLTMAHEFAHVITQTELELDRFIFDDECSTYYNGLGCFDEDSLMWAWMTEFWDPDVLAALDPEHDPLVSDGDERCSLDDSYFGAYAASNPEEDFAEAFSAFVYGLEAETPGQQQKLDWLADQPGLAEFRERADAAGLTPQPNTFDICGE